MNMGVADAADLGWKLAAALEGWGGARLLESYETERRAIHEEVIAEAAANHAVLSNDFWSDGLETPGRGGDTLRQAAGKRIVALKTREFRTLGTVLGGCYANSPILPLSDAATSSRDESGDYLPKAVPGCIAPHSWRADGSSLYDAFGSGFALLLSPEAPVDAEEQALRDAAEAGIPLACVRLTATEADDRYLQPITLVRPDQVVAWRGFTWDSAALGFAAGRVVK